MSTTGLLVEALVDEGLGNSAHLVDLGDGRALAVDAARDLRSVRELATRRGLKVAYAADTHLHADFLSGAVQLAATDGAVVLASAAGNRAFPHRRLAEVLPDVLPLARGGQPPRPCSPSRAVDAGAAHGGAGAGDSSTMGRRSSTSAPSSSTPRRMCPGHCRSSCARRSAPGSAGCCHDAVVVVLRSLDQDPAEIFGQAAKVGYDIAGELARGIEAWTDADLATTSTALVAPTTMTDVERALDIRQDSEFAAGHVPGAEHRELGSVAGAAASLASGPVTVMCGHGERAMSAASVLERAGHDDVNVLLGGPGDWAASHGVDLEFGS